MFLLEILSEMLFSKSEILLVKDVFVNRSFSSSLDRINETAAHKISHVSVDTWIVPFKDSSQLKTSYYSPTNISGKNSSIWQATKIN